jgi:hypothetical protein
MGRVPRRGVLWRGTERRDGGRRARQQKRAEHAGTGAELAQQQAAGKDRGRSHAAFLTRSFG